MTSISMEELEHAATSVAICWDPNERKLAEEKLLNFRKMKEPYDLCQKILDSSHNECLLFETARTLGEAVCREWTDLIGQPNGAARIEALLLQLIQWAAVNQQKLSSFVRESALRAASAIVKRSSAENGTILSLMSKLLNDAEQRMNSGDIAQQVFAVSLLSALLHEMSLTDKSYRIGMTWENHSLIRRRFEENEMVKIFGVYLSLADQMVNYQGDLTNSHISELTYKILSSLDQLLSWDFLAKRIPRKYIGRFRSSERTTLRPNDKWKEFFVDNSLINLFFKIHMRVRQCSNLGVTSLTCLVQLSSLNGPVIDQDVACRDRYYVTLVDSLVRHIESIELIDYEFPLVRELIGNLTLNGHLQNAVQTEAACQMQLGPRFLHCFADLIVKCIEGAALETLVSAENPVCSETLDKLLTDWTSLSSNGSAPSGWLPSDPEHMIKSCNLLNARIFDSFLRSHLASPEGFRNRTPDGHIIAESDCTEVDLDCEEEDDLNFEDSLYAIGICSRDILSQALPLLARLLHERTSLLLTTQGNPAATWLLEDIHWLVLITGHILIQTSADTSDRHLGPSSSPIPENIMRHSLCQKNANLQETQLLFINCVSQPPQSLDWPSSSINVDDVVRMISGLYRLLWMTSSRCDSPQVASDVFWVMSRICTSYLVIDETKYSEVSPTLLMTMRPECSSPITALLQVCQLSFKTWCAESDVLERISLCISGLIENNSSAQIVVSTETWWSLVRSICQLDSPFDTFPMNVLHQLVSAAMLASKVVTGSQQEGLYWSITLEPIRQRADRVLSALSPSNDQTRQKMAVIEVLILLHGVPSGTRLSTSGHIFSILMLPQLEKCCLLVELFHSSSEVMQPLLELFCEVSDRCLCYLSVEHTGALYTYIMNLIHLYVHKNLNTRTFEVNAEEEQFADVKVILVLLSNMLAKEFIDFDEGSSKAEAAGFPTATEIVIQGLNSLIPLMNQDMLSIPDIGERYYKVLDYVCDVNARKVFQLSDAIFAAFLQSLQLGLQRYTTEVCKLCLEIIHNLAEESVAHGEVRPGALKPFLPQLFTLFTQDTFDLDVTDVAAITVLALICANKDNYSSVVTSCLSQLPANQSQRLLTSFETLTPDINALSMNRSCKLAFIERFEKFVLDVRSFLCVF